MHEFNKETKNLIDAFENKKIIKALTDELLNELRSKYHGIITNKRTNQSSIQSNRRH